MSDLLERDLAHKPAFPSFPCFDTCARYSDSCNEYVELDERLKPNCSAVGTLAGGATCDTPSWIADWPESESLLGIINNKAVVTQCNQFQAPAAVEVLCYAPFVKPEGDGVGIVRREFPDSSCELPCPASFMFPESDWRSLHKLMFLTVPSFILNSFLLATWLIFPKRRKQTHVVRFLSLTWAVSLVLVLGFAAVPSHAPIYDLRYIQCSSNVEAYPMGFNFCTVQAVTLFWCSLSLAARWLVITLDAYLSVVKNKKHTGVAAKKKHMLYDLLCYGFPTFALALFLSLGGKLVGDACGRAAVASCVHHCTLCAHGLPCVVCVCCRAAIMRPR